MSNKFLYLSLSRRRAAQAIARGMQAAYAAWGAWRSKFSNEVTAGEGLKPGSAAVVKGGSVTDGPYIEAKEIVASYAFVSAESLQRAVEIAKECPIHGMGGCIEIRELGGW